MRRPRRRLERRARRRVRVIARDSMMCISTSRCDIMNTVFAPRAASRESVFDSRSALEAPRGDESRAVILTLAVSRCGTRTARSLRFAVVLALTGASR